MSEEFNLDPREKRLASVLLEGCDTREMAKRLKCTERTVKRDLNRLFVRFKIEGGIKRVKLATMLYRKLECPDTEAES